MEKNNEFAWLASQVEKETVKHDIILKTSDLTVEEFVNKLLEVMKTNPEVKDFKMEGVCDKSLKNLYQTFIYFKSKTVFVELY